MTIKKDNKSTLKYYKEKIRNIGKRSIHDIIKDKNLSFEDKVDYIRHHYTYYEGNYEYFHDERGAANWRKEKLNNLIRLIILRVVDPSELKKINKKIYKWRKKQQGQPIVEKIKTKQEPKLTYDDVAAWKDTLLCGKKRVKVLPVVEEYLLSLDNTLDVGQLQNQTYRQVKKAAKAWRIDKFKKDMCKKVKKEANEKALIEFNIKLLAQNDNKTVNKNEVV